MDVLDVNDEDPYFTNTPTPLLAVVRRDDPVGTVIYNVQAKDPDSDFNNTLQLEFILSMQQKQRQNKKKTKTNLLHQSLVSYELH